MPKVRIATIIERLDSNMRSALAEAVTEVLPGANVDSYGLFRAFVRAVERRCSTWEKVPERCVKTD